MARYVFFGSKAPDELRVLRVIPITLKGQTLPVGRPIITTAVSVNDSDKKQSFSFTPEELVNWDGTTPIVVFGSFFYEDAFGNKYCNDFASTHLHDSMWGDVSGENPESCDKHQQKTDGK